MTPPSKESVMEQREALREARKLWGDDGHVLTQEDDRGRLWHYVGFRVPEAVGGGFYMRTRGIGLTWELAFLDAKLARKSHRPKGDDKRKGEDWPESRKRRLRIVKGQPS